MFNSSCVRVILLRTGWINGSRSLRSGIADGSENTMDSSQVVSESVSKRGVIILLVDMNWSNDYWIVLCRLLYLCIYLWIVLVDCLNRGCICSFYVVPSTITVDTEVQDLSSTLHKLINFLLICEQLGLVHYYILTLQNRRHKN